MPKKTEKATSPVPKKKSVKSKAVEVTGAPMPLMTFPDAINALIGGASIRRVEWIDPEEYCLLKDSFLMIHRNNQFHSWLVSEGDMMARDWVVKK